MEWGTPRSSGEESARIAPGCPEGNQRGLQRGTQDSATGYRGEKEGLQGEAGGEADCVEGERGSAARVPGAPAGRPSRRGALTCFPAAAARDFCRNCRSRGSEGAAETVPTARAMESRARAHCRRHDSISPAGRARAGGGGEELTAPLLLGSGVGDLLGSRRLFKPFS